MSSLPSWSWCGWQAFVDPWSLRSGVAYIGDQACSAQAASWTTKNLVQWYALTSTDSQAIMEPIILENHIQSATNSSQLLPTGWIQSDFSSSNVATCPFGPGPSFLYANDTATIFQTPCATQTKRTTCETRLHPRLITSRMFHNLSTFLSCYST